MHKGRRIHDPSHSSTRRVCSIVLVLGLVHGLVAGAAWASGGVTFTDIAAGGGAGLVYSRTPSATIATFDFLTTLPVLTPADWVVAPEKPHGAPGVALFDYDGDGDLDIYVSNGPGTPNSLFENRLRHDTGSDGDGDGGSDGDGDSDGDDDSDCDGDDDSDGDD
ncbi:MAG: hypothetical protein MI919_17865, partial [Holophagales bacterium]|nr:hypothetical protein [Holophagales bacterium]